MPDQVRSHATCEGGIDDCSTIAIGQLDESVREQPDSPHLADTAMDRVVPCGHRLALRADHRVNAVDAIIFPHPRRPGASLPDLSW